MVGLNYWAVANGLGAHTVTLSESQLHVQFKVRGIDHAFKVHANKV